MPHPAALHPAIEVDIMAQTAAAQRTWEAENEVITVDPAANALYALPDPTAYAQLQQAAPWKGNPNYFTHVRISALALLKMTMHARSGGSLEVMGLMLGYVSGTSIVVTDAFRLPVEGTETRVNAQGEADEYMIAFMAAAREGGGQAENAIGWYHSHPGYGCWLSGIDIETERLHQQGQDPFVAVVVDPERTVSAGKVDIGAFRTYAKGAEPAPGQPGGDDDDDGFQAIPADKIEDFGAHANAYYALEVVHFKTTLDAHLLGQLWNKYWTSTLAQAPLFTNREYAGKQLRDHADRVRTAADRHKRAAAPSNLAQAHAAAVLVPAAAGDAPANRNFRVARHGDMDTLVRTSDRIAGDDVAGLLAEQVKNRLFWGVVQEAQRT